MCELALKHDPGQDLCPLCFDIILIYSSKMFQFKCNLTVYNFRTFSWHIFTIPMFQKTILFLTGLKHASLARFASGALLLWRNILATRLTETGCFQIIRRFFLGKTNAEKMGPQFEEHQTWETKQILSRCGKTIGNWSCFRNIHLAPKPIDIVKKSLEKTDVVSHPTRSWQLNQTIGGRLPRDLRFHPGGPIAAPGRTLGAQIRTWLCL